ncbi:hypothetical protein CWI37_0596p0010, partial [Hamiltosporidium tvaerminnensis]
MALLAGEIENNEWTKGIIKADGTYREDNDWIKNYIFCKNTNVFLPYITVNDAIRFCFLFKDNYISSLEEIEETLKLFKLFRIRNNKIEQLIFLGLNKFHREIYSIIDSIVILNKGRTVFSGTKKSYIEFLKKYNIELSGKKFRNLEFLSQLSIQKGEKSNIDSTESIFEIQNNNLIDNMAEYTKSQFKNTDSINWKQKSESVYDFSFNIHQIYNLLKEFKNNFFKMGYFAGKTYIVFFSILFCLIYFRGTIFPIINETVRHNIDVIKILELSNVFEDPIKKSYNPLINHYYELIVEISWNAILSLIYRCSVEIIPYVMTWDGIVTKYHKSHLKRLEIPMNVETYIQSIVLKKTLETNSFDRLRGLESGLNATESWERASMGVIMRSEMHEEPTPPLKEARREED